jgi:hypothetical protein
MRMTPNVKLKMFNYDYKTAKLRARAVRRATF